MGLGAVPATGGRGGICKTGVRAGAGGVGRRTALCGGDRICGRRILQRE